MISSKKALENYVFVLLGVSFIMTILLFFFLNLAYGSDHPACQEVQLDFEVLCKQNGIPKIKVTNLGNEDTYFILNGERNVDQFKVKGLSSTELRLGQRGVDDITLLPLARGDEIFYECRGKTVRKTAEAAVRC